MYQKFIDKMGRKFARSSDKLTDLLIANEICQSDWLICWICQRITQPSKWAKSSVVIAVLVGGFVILNLNTIY